LSEGTPYLPKARWQRAKVLEWLFFEQYNHEPNIATVRFWIKFVGLNDERRAALGQKQKLGYAALDVMEKHLAQHAFFVADAYTIADIALYAYTHVAGEGDFDLAPYRAVREWMDRVRAQPGHVPITQS
jgi:glutathione S-transferase